MYGKNKIMKILNWHNVGIYLFKVESTFTIEQYKKNKDKYDFERLIRKNMLK